MKTIIAAFLAVGLMSTAASAWSDLPGYGYGNGHGNWQTYGEHQPSFPEAQKPVIEKAAPEVAPLLIAQATEPDRTPQARK